MGPVVRSKKGECRGILEEIQRGGFVRVRIDGIVYRVGEALEKTLDKNKKHNIEVVVDRLVIDKELDRSRLADSLEIGLRMGKGIIIVNVKRQMSLDRAKRETPHRVAVKSKKEKDLLFSEHFACEECGISLPELEPRLFSFNSPYGACSECMGLGEKLEVDPKLVIPNQNLTIAEGAIRPYMRVSNKIGRQSYFWQQLSDLAEEYNFSLNEAVRDLPKRVINVILYGDVRLDSARKARLASARQGKFDPSPLAKGKGFEGVIPNLERKYHGTDSEWTRREIEQYMVVRKCPECLGKRLKPEVLAITVCGKSINEIVEMSIDKAKNP